MWTCLASIHGHRDKRRSVLRSDAGGGDCADATDRDFSRLAYGTDLLDPLNLDAVRQLHHHRPTVEQIVDPAFVPTRIPNVGVSMLHRVCVNFARSIGRRGAYLLQQSYIGIHLQ